MFTNKKWMKLTALIVMVMMSVSLLASCQAGRTYVDEPGNEGAVSVIPKDEQVKVPYTGLPLENIVYTDDPAYAPTTDNNTSGGDTIGGDATGGDTTGDTIGGDVTEDGTTTDDSTDEETTDDSTDVEFEEDGVHYDEQNTYTILSYNVRSQNDGSGKAKAERAPNLKKVADNYDADIMGFQEVTPDWCQYTIDYFSEEYGYSYLFRASGKTEPANAHDEAETIFYKKDKFEMLETGHFWISDSPNVLSLSWDDGMHRICTWVKLKIKATGKIFYHFNLHTGLTDTCEDNSTKIILTQLLQIVGNYGATITGDFNMPQWGNGYKNFVLSGDVGDVNYDLNNDPAGTVDGYHLNKTEPKGPNGIIDFCFYSIDKIVPISYKVVDGYTEVGAFVSDHRGLFVEAAVAS